MTDTDTDPREGTVIAIPGSGRVIVFQDGRWVNYTEADAKMAGLVK